MYLEALLLYNNLFSPNIFVNQIKDEIEAYLLGDVDMLITNSKKLNKNYIPSLIRCN